MRGRGGHRSGVARVNGILIVDKPKGFTSFDVIAKLRGMLRERRMGHGGTLDPMATGALPVFIGEATKLADRDPDNTKEYAATVRLGMKTDTGDVTGAVTAEGGARPSRETLEAALAAKTGEQLQLPPMYSAVKIGGKKLYEYARAGREVERKPRAVTIYAAALTAYDAAAGEFSMTVRCSKGTYIRTLAEDVCESAGAYGALSALRRAKSGSFSVGGAHTLEEIQAAADAGRTQSLLLAADALFSAYRRVELSGEPLRMFMNGVRFETALCASGAAPGESFRVYAADKFIGLAADDGGVFKKTLHYNG